MLAHIVRHEVRDVVRDGRVRWAAAFVLVLLAASLLTAWSVQRQVAVQHASAERLARETWLRQPARDPHTAAHYGAYAFKPRGPLTLFDNGVNDYSGVAVWLEAHKRNEFQFRPAQDRPVVARLGQLTGAATLQGLVPVLIILVAYAKYAAEREDGTLRQLLACGVPPLTLALGKLLGVAVVLGMVLVPAAVMGSLAIVIAAGPQAAGAVALRTVVLTAVYLAYFGVCLLVALAVSVASRRASHALAVLVGFWIMNAVIVPRFAVDEARRQHPTPTAFEFAQRVHHDTYGGLALHDFYARRADELRARLLRQYGVARVEDLPVNIRGVDYLERETRSDEVWDTHYGRLWAAFDAQARVHATAAWAAPLVAVRHLSMALAGVDAHHHRHFADAADAYRRVLVRAMNTRLAYGGNSRRLGAYVAEANFWSSVAPFTYKQPSITWALSHTWGAVAALGGWLVASALALALAVTRSGVL